MVEIPSIKINKKVKSIQMFKQPVQKALQGDRLGICVTQLDPKVKYYFHTRYSKHKNTLKIMSIIAS